MATANVRSLDKEKKNDVMIEMLDEIIDRDEQD